MLTRVDTPIPTSAAGACVALTALLLKRTRWSGNHGPAAAVGGATGEAGDAAGAAVGLTSMQLIALRYCSLTAKVQVFTCVRLLVCISDSDPVRCARLCPRMLRAASMASKCTPGTTGDALLRRSNAQLQTLLQTLAAVASGEAADGSEKEEEAASVALTPTTRKGNKRRRFRSRNSVLDHWLADDKVSVSHGSVPHG